MYKKKSSAASPGAMSRLPFTHIRISNAGRLLAIAGRNVRIYDTTTGALQHAYIHPTLVRCVAADAPFARIVIADDAKRLAVLEPSDASLSVTSIRALPKKAAAVRLTHDGTRIIVADKFGDVYSYPFTPPAIHAPGPTGTLLLGHVSVLTDFLLTADERYIITADRDEHIRVSAFPAGWAVHAYCLGSASFVAALHIPRDAPGVLVSGGGEPVLRVWDWAAGRCVRTISVGDAVLPTVVARERKRKWDAPVPDAGGDGGAGKRRRAADNASPAPVLAVAKIESLRGQLVFCATGATALFSVPLEEGKGEQTVQTVDFGVPVLDFALDGDALWVSVDADWMPAPDTTPVSRPARRAPCLRLVRWDNAAGQFAEHQLPVLDAIEASAIEGSDAQRAALDLYGALALLPKVSGEGEGSDGEGDDSRSYVSTEKERGRVRAREKIAQVVAGREAPAGENGSGMS